MLEKRTMLVTKNSVIAFIFLKCTFLPLPTTNYDALVLLSLHYVNMFEKLNNKRETAMGTSCSETSFSQFILMMKTRQT